MELTVQIIFGEDKSLTNIQKVLKMVPNVAKLSINSQLEGTLECDPVELNNLTVLKVDFTCTDDQCKNFY